MNSILHIIDECYKIITKSNVNHLLNLETEQIQLSYS